MGLFYGITAEVGDEIDKPNTDKTRTIVLDTSTRYRKPQREQTYFRHSFEDVVVIEALPWWWQPRMWFASEAITWHRVRNQFLWKETRWWRCQGSAKRDSCHKSLIWMVSEEVRSSRNKDCGTRLAMFNSWSIWNSASWSHLSYSGNSLASRLMFENNRIVSPPPREWSQMIRRVGWQHATSIKSTISCTASISFATSFNATTGLATSPNHGEITYTVWETKNRQLAGRQRSDERSSWNPRYESLDRLYGLFHLLLPIFNAVETSCG